MDHWPPHLWVGSPYLWLVGRICVLFLGKLRITCTIHWQLKVYFVRAMDRNGLGHICRQIWLSSHMDHWLSRKFVLHICTPDVARALLNWSFPAIVIFSQHYPTNLIWISPTPFAVMVNRKKSLSHWIFNQWNELHHKWDSQKVWKYIFYHSDKSEKKERRNHLQKLQLLM